MPSRFGPAPRFRAFHLWKALLELSRVGPLGRQRLSERLGLGEGSARTLVRALVSWGLVRTDARGMRLTARGRRELQRAHLGLAAVRARGICVGERSVAVHVRGAASRVRDGLRQRDEAVMAGADGATTLVLRGGRLIMPPETDIDSSCPELSRQLRAAFDLRDGDAIIIGSARVSRRAEDGALAAAIDLMGG